MSVLVLAGTAEARALCRVLTRSRAVIASLAGVTHGPADYGCEVQRGGFGGPAGLAAFLSRRGVRAVIDATHPFASRISAHAAGACSAAAIPRLVLRRAAWVPQEGDAWRMVETLDAAIDAVPDGARVFAATGRETRDAWDAWRGGWVLLRAVDAPVSALRGAGGWARGLPRAAADEAAFLRGHGITHVVTKNSGGEAGRGKLIAARGLSLPVIMVARPAAVPGLLVETVDEAVLWALSQPR